jgi:hypothetical protein
VLSPPSIRNSHAHGQPPNPWPCVAELPGDYKQCHRDSDARQAQGIGHTTADDSDCTAQVVVAVGPVVAMVKRARHIRVHEIWLGVVYAPSLEGICPSRRACCAAFCEPWNLMSARLTATVLFCPQAGSRNNTRAPCGSPRESMDLTRSCGHELDKICILILITHVARGSWAAFS